MNVTAIVSKFANPSFARWVGGSVRLAKARFVASYREAIATSAASRLGGSASDYAVLLVPEEHPAFARLMQGDAFTLTWNGVDATTFSVDFAAEDESYEPVFTASVASIPANGKATSTVTMRLMRKSDGAVATNVNRDFILPVGHPMGYPLLVGGTIANGVATWTFKTTQAGFWRFPAEGEFSLPGASRTRDGKETTIAAYQVDF